MIYRTTFWYDGLFTGCKKLTYFIVISKTNKQKKKKNEESIPLQPSGSQKCVEEGAKANSSHSVKATPKTGQDDEHETKEVNKWNFTPQAV